MTEKHRTDVVIIGAGIIGVAIAFELSKRGYRTLNIDRLTASGSGPTINSCAIVRAHYSSREGVAMAHESCAYWRDWKQYLGVTDDYGMAQYVETGVVLVKSATGHHKKVMRHYRDLGLDFEEWTPSQLTERFPIYSTRSFWPPKRPDDPGSGTSQRRNRWGCLHPGRGVRRRSPFGYAQSTASGRGTRRPISCSSRR